MSQPIEAAAWLADKFYLQGGCLVSGQIILTGNAAPVTRLESDRGTATIEVESLDATRLKIN
jgi:2-keto-4-pentenoate hydratase